MCATRDNIVAADVAKGILDTREQVVRVHAKSVPRVRYGGFPLYLHDGD